MDNSRVGNYEAWLIDNCPELTKRWSEGLWASCSGSISDYPDFGTFCQTLHDETLEVYALQEMLKDFLNHQSSEDAAS